VTSLPNRGVREVRGDTRLTVRKARHPKNCTHCPWVIHKNELYCEAVAPPWYEFNPNPGHWTVHAICYRHPLFWPVPPKKEGRHGQAEPA
jgi:hypothetical protein